MPRYTVPIDTPLTEEESALLALAGWNHAGGGILDRSTGMPYPDGQTRLCFRHDDGRKVAWTRAEARVEVRRVRALWSQVSALLRVARAAREWEEAQRVYTGLFESSACEGGMGGAERRLDRAEDELRAALAALDKEAGDGV